MSRQYEEPSNDEDERHVRNVLEECAGRGWPRTGGSTKLLRFMLFNPAGCDAYIDTHRFTVVFAGDERRHEYFMSIAPEVVSALLAWGGVSEASGTVRAVIEPALRPHPEEGRPSYGTRFLWMRVEPSLVTIRLRRETDAQTGDPDPLPVLPRIAPCPHCGEPLRTPRAKQCRFCRRDWHDPERVRPLGG